MNNCIHLVVNKIIYFLGGKLCVPITIRNTNNAPFSVRRRISIKEIPAAFPAVIGKDVQTTPAGVWTKKFRRSCVQTLSCNR